MSGLIQTIINFFKALYDAVLRGFDYINAAIDYFIDFFLNLPQFIFSKLTDGVVSLFEAIPVPDFFTALPSVFSAIPQEVVYFAQPFNLGYGLSVIFSAYILRFIIRRLPFVG